MITTAAILCPCGRVHHLGGALLVCACGRGWTNHNEALEELPGAAVDAIRRALEPDPYERLRAIRAVREGTATEEQSQLVLAIRRSRAAAGLPDPVDWVAGAGPDGGIAWFSARTGEPMP